MYDVIVIGAGPAGMTAAIYAKRSNLKVLLVEKGAPGGQVVSTKEVENYPGFMPITGPDLSLNMFNHVMELEIETEFNEVVKVEVKDNFKYVTLDDERVLSAKALILANGVVPRNLGVLGEDKFSMRGISWCAICDGPFYKGKDVVVIGGGNSAVEEGAFLASIANKVTFVQNLKDFTAAQAAIDNLKKFNNIDYHFEAVVTEFIGNEELTHVKIKKPNNQEILIKTDGVFEYIGLIPSSEIISHLGITNKYGYIVTDEALQTNIPGIFAAGDVREKEIRQIVTATGDGAIASQGVLKYLKGC
ncbi:MAG: FAD-dependent oxidoreductase [Acholeplasmataceae bacterium]|jgi:thioredoxin reductase (NADPH)|nr:FAD-dependent oxidoreductase [Acholeplasmataceae bacterium]